jgi:hypothetical protein
LRSALRQVASTIAVVGMAAWAARPSIIRATTPLSRYRFQWLQRVLGGPCSLSTAVPKALAIEEEYPAKNPPVIDALLAVNGS